MIAVPRQWRRNTFDGVCHAHSNAARSATRCALCQSGGASASVLKCVAVPSPARVGFGCGMPHCWQPKSIPC
eukprot:7387558-Prymnesium_polylepis.2